MDSARVKKDQITSLTLHQHRFTSKRVSKLQLNPITSTIFDPRISLNYLILGGIVVSLRYDLQSTHSICSHIDQRDHTLYTMKSTLVVRILIHMQILDKRVPT